MARGLKQAPDQQCSDQQNWQIKVYAAELELGQGFACQRQIHILMSSIRTGSCMVQATVHQVQAGGRFAAIEAQVQMRPPDMHHEQRDAEQRQQPRAEAGFEQHAA
nr:hypothetical protein [Nitrosomonas nitrosa]